MPSVRNYQDLICWQLAHDLQCEVWAITASGAVNRDFKFRDQIRDSAASAPRNMAEGFGRFRRREFARFLEIARGSLTETHNHLRDGLERGYFSESDQARAGTAGRPRRDRDYTSDSLFKISEEPRLVSLNL